MSFFIRTLQLDRACTAQALLDGKFLSLDVMCQKRQNALVELFPCQSPCCAGTYPSAVIHRVPPLKLSMRLTSSRLFHFSLTRSSQQLQDATEYLPSSPFPFAIPITCDLSFSKKTNILTVHIIINKKPFKTLMFRDDIRFHPPHLRSFYLNQSSPLSRLWPESSFNTFSPMTSNIRKQWTCTQIFGTFSNTSKQLKFDDTTPVILGLTGKCAWDGLHESQNVRICELLFWSTVHHIVGFQAIYIVNEKRITGPRHRLDHQHFQFREDRLIVHQYENITKIKTRKSFTGSMLQIAFMTDRGRTIQAGCIQPPSSSVSETITLPSSTRVVSFRGSLGDGLDTFALVHEYMIKHPDASSNSLCYCKVCGANRHYFMDDFLFETHVESCKEKYPLSLLRTQGKTFME